MLVIRQEDPGRKDKAVFLSPLPYYAGQALEFGFPQAFPGGVAAGR
jgi:hypothetical protein